MTEFNGTMESPWWCTCTHTKVPKRSKYVLVVELSTGKRNLPSFFITEKLARGVGVMPITPHHFREKGMVLVVSGGRRNKGMVPFTAYDCTRRAWNRQLGMVVHGARQWRFYRRLFSPPAGPLLSAVRGVGGSSSRQAKAFKSCAGFAIVATLGAAMIVHSVFESNSETLCEEESHPPHKNNNTDNDHNQGVPDPNPTKAPIPLCGEWCATAPNPSQQACRMDTRRVGCQGEHCITTAALWKWFVLTPRHARPRIPCQLYSDGKAYPVETEPCSIHCLIPEIRKERYPGPTGLGLLCQKNSCRPAATGCLECPCNWFGSDCPDDWVPIRRIRRRRLADYLDHVTIGVDVDHWNAIVKNRLAGGVVRINTQDPATQEVYELVCAVAKCDIPGEIEFLVSQPDPSLRWEVRKIADLLRANELTTTTKKSAAPNDDGEWSTVKPDVPLFVNPIISAFYNQQYDYLMDTIHSATTGNQEAVDNEEAVKQIVIVTTGSGLSGALSAIDMLRPLVGGDNGLRIHVYHGLRDVQHLPYRETLQELVQSNIIQLTLVTSNNNNNNRSGGEDERDEIDRAVQRGTSIQKALQEEKNKDHKIYVQHVMESDWRTATANQERSNDTLLPLKNTGFVVCGHLPVMNETRAIVARLFTENNRAAGATSSRSTVPTPATEGASAANQNDASAAAQFVARRVFLNI